LLLLCNYFYPATNVVKKCSQQKEMSEYTTKKAMKLANLKENNFFKST